jgi:mitochondrial fission protein ELM1
LSDDTDKSWQFWRNRLTSIPASNSDIWVLLTHAPGDNDQSLALADALGASSVVKRIDWPLTDPEHDRALVRALLADTADALQRRNAIGLNGPWPRIVICCGRRADRVGFWIKRQSGDHTKVVSIGRAHQPVARYDLLAAPPQYALPERANIVRLPLPLARRRQDNALARDHAAAGGNMVPVAKPWFTILLGGEVKEFVVSPQELERTARAAQEAADRHGGSVVVSTSRRTSPEMLAIVEGALKNPYVYRWSPANRDENPYEVLLAQSAALFVTPDSASMMLDCAASGTPTFMVEYPERLNLRRRLRRDLYRTIRNAIESCRSWGLGRVGRWLDRAQEALHAKGLLRYPRDLRQLNASIFDMALAKRIVDFDPARLPVRTQIANDLSELSGLRQLAERCRAL